MRLWLLLWSLICSRTPVSICFIVVKLRASSHGWKRWKPSEPNGAEPVTSVTPTFPIVIVWGNHKNISSVRTCPHWSKLQLELVTPPQWKTLNIEQIKICPVYKYLVFMKDLQRSILSKLNTQHDWKSHTTAVNRFQAWIHLSSGPFRH